MLFLSKYLVSELLYNIHVLSPHPNNMHYHMLVPLFHKKRQRYWTELWTCRFHFPQPVKLVLGFHLR